MTTEKLFYTDAYINKFKACVLSCESNADGYSIILDKTAFFPNEGGQPADTGFIGSAAVCDVIEADGSIYHVTNKPLVIGKEYDCALDFGRRFRHMQTHSGEHILSGLINTYLGYNNVGFHINRDCPGCTVDYSGVITREQLSDIEKKCNEVIYNNIPIKQLFPNTDELSRYNYRSKLELTDNVRLISIENVDLCACCAPHVSRTGEIGLLKVFSAVSHRSGTRIVIVCGEEAFNDYLLKYDSIVRIASALSAKHNEAATTVERLLNDNTRLKKEIAELNTNILLSAAANEHIQNGNLCFFTTSACADSLRIIVNGFLARCAGLCAAFSGNDEKGYTYVIGSVNENMSTKIKEINAALNGKGGGKANMVQGSVLADKEKIKRFFYGSNNKC